MSKAVVCFSGGIDSSTCALEAMENNDEVVLVHFDYGQPFENVEEKRARERAKNLDLSLEIVDVKPIIQEHYAEGCAIDRDWKALEDKHKRDEVHRSTTTVPIRNLLFLTIATGIGDHKWEDEDIKVYIGSNKGEGYRCADCRPEMIENAQPALDWSTRRNDIEVVTPLLDLEKWEIIKEAESMGVDFSKTSSCSNPQDEKGTLCGVCPSCKERLEAFYNAQVDDPLAPPEVVKEFEKEIDEKPTIERDEN